MKYYLRLIKYLYPHKNWIVLTWLISLVILALQGISVWVGADFIEKLIRGDTQEFVARGGYLASQMDHLIRIIIHWGTPFESLIAGVSILIASAVLIAFFRIFKLYLFTCICQSILMQIRLEMFSLLTRLDLSFFRKNLQGEIASLAVKDVNNLKMSLFDIADRIFMQPIRFAMAISLMISLSVKLTFIAIVAIVLSSLAVLFTGNYIERRSRVLLENIAGMQGHLTQYLASTILSKSLGKEEFEINRFTGTCQALADADKKFDIAHSIAPQFVNILFLCSGGALMILGGYDVLVTKTLQSSTLLKMALLLPLVTSPMEAMASLYISARTSAASSKRIFNFLDQKPICEDLPDAVDPVAPVHSIEIINLSYSSGENEILKGINIEIPVGSKVVFYGPSGSGKTTLLSLLARLICPTEGKILIDGADLRMACGEKWRAQLGIVNQEPILLNDTVRENLLYADRDAPDSVLIEKLREVLLWNEVSAFEGGLDTQVGNRGEMISGGERQRLTVARAMLTNPKVLLLDEPTSMLDSASKKIIRDILKAMSPEYTVIIATHDPLIRDIAHVSYMIDNGAVSKDA